MSKGLGSIALSALLLASATPVIAQTAEQVRRYSVPPGNLDRALAEFARQSGQQILYTSELVEGRRSAGLNGLHTAEGALAIMLRDTGLTYRRTRPNVFTVVEARSNPDPQYLGEATVLDEIVVTGSLIRGAGDGPSPVVTVTREQMDRDGRSTVAQLLANLPQNFGGTANESAVNIGDRTGTNGTYASGVNLRGLGSDATLVLINGRRMAGTGAKGDFADVSTIPTIAVQRVDVLLDGASALYGADAVGGVVNIILRTDYEGAETRARIGNTWDGASGEYQFGQAFGRRWSTGNALIAYEYHDRQPLSTDDRRRAGDADMRWLGGTDQRRFYSNPGNIILNNPAMGGAYPAYAIPRGQSGAGLQPTDFLAGEVNLENQRAGMYVLPHQTRHGLYAAARQEIGDRFQVSADARFGSREFETLSGAISTLLTVNAANPYFASPTGASSHNIAYSFRQELPSPRYSGRVESFGSSLGGELRVFGDWVLDAYVAYASESRRDGSTGSLQSTFLREALGAIADDPQTPFSAARDGYLNPFGDGAVNNAAVLDFISSGFSRSQGRTEVTSINAQFSGTLMTLPGGPVRLAAGLSVREETFERQATTFTSGVTPNVGAPFAADRTVSAAFAEVRLPVFGEANRRTGFERLDFSVAARFEDYGDAGQTVSPKVGVLWEPSDTLLLRANYGRSFRAPALRELHDAASASPSILPRGGNQILTMILYGGNPDIEPEEADSWTGGFEYRPAGIPGLRLGANVFRIDFENRIGQPALESILTALGDPSLAPFVRTIDPVNNAEDRAAMQAILDLPTTGLRDLFPATSYGAIVDARYVNTARMEVRGADIMANYAFDVGSNGFDVGMNLTWLERFDTQPTPTSATISQVDLPNFPVSLRSRSTASWSREAWTVSGALNYVGSYRDLADRRIGSWTTVDLSVRYAPSHGWLDGTTFVLSGQNLFDRDPPFYDSPYGVAYDPTNANVLGRFISLQVTKAW